MEKASSSASEKAVRELKHEFYRGNTITFAAAMTATVLLSAFNLIVSWLMQQLIDIASGGETRFSLGSIAIISGFLLLFLVLALFADRSFRPRFLRRALRQYKDKAFELITKKSIGSFAGENTSVYISALTNDASVVETSYLAKLFSLVMLCLMFVGALTMMLLYSPILTLIAVLLSLFPVAASLLAGKRLAAAEKSVSESNAGFVGMVKDLLSGFTVIKSFRAEAEVLRMFSARNGELEDKKRFRRRVECLIQLLGASTGVLAQLGVFIVGAYLAVTGKGVTAGVVIVFVQLMNFVLQPISEVPQILAGKKSADALIEKFADCVCANVRHEGAKLAPVLTDAIELRDLTFAYEKDAPVLKGISLRFEAGKSYALVGGSGSGKSTLLNLLLGSRDDYGGEILIDGRELRDVGSDSLFDLISIVQQNVFIFDNTLRSNITMFRDFDRAKVDAAIASAGLEPLIEQRGEDYMCGENGVGLSGGERQRVSIARSLLRGTPVLLVDEATAALDAATAAAVTGSILDISGLTRVVVTHRLEAPALRRYDEILVLRGGKICESGSYDSLMERKGYFYSLYTVAQGE